MAKSEKMMCGNGVQCDQVEIFLNDFGDKLFHKSSPNIWKPLVDI